MITVRQPTSDDLSAVRSLLLESFSRRLHPYLTYTQSGIHRFLELRLAQSSSFPGSEILVACDEFDHLVGFADFRIAEDLAFLSYICVSAQARRSGVGKALLSRLVEKSHSQARLELDVFDESEAAHRLYGSLGFEAVSRQAWISRALPEGSSPLGVPSIKDVLASQSIYGFCDLTLGPPTPGHRFGMLGTGMLRCFDSADIGNDDLLASLRATFPGLTRAFTIAPEGAESDLGTQYEVVNRSTRLSRQLSHDTNRLENAR